MKTVILPKELTVENGANALLMGEFQEERYFICPECGGDGNFGDDEICDICEGDGVLVDKCPVSWTTIKEIYKKIVENMEITQGE